MRFIKNQEKTPSICREFQVSEQIASALILHFDCLWNLKLDNQPYHFDYQAVTSSGDSYIYRYLFFAPSSERIGEYSFTIDTSTLSYGILINDNFNFILAP